MDLAANCLEFGNKNNNGMVKLNYEKEKLVISMFCREEEGSVLYTNFCLLANENSITKGFCGV